jgi:hypothetical protein
LAIPTAYNTLWFGKALADISARSTVGEMVTFRGAGQAPESLKTNAVTLADNLFGVV